VVESTAGLVVAAVDKDKLDGEAGNAEDSVELRLSVLWRGILISSSIISRLDGSGY
jgi:hypothetical protein